MYIVEYFTPYTHQLRQQSFRTYQEANAMAAFYKSCGTKATVRSLWALAHLTVGFFLCVLWSWYMTRTDTRSFLLNDSNWTPKRRRNVYRGYSTRVPLNRMPVMADGGVSAADMQRGDYWVTSPS